MTSIVASPSFAANPMSLPPLYETTPESLAGPRGTSRQRGRHLSHESSRFSFHAQIPICVVCVRRNCPCQTGTQNDMLLLLVQEQPTTKNAPYPLYTRGFRRGVGVHSIPLQFLPQRASMTASPLSKSFHHLAGCSFAQDTICATILQPPSD